jgi:dihydrofolate reductase
MSITLVAAVASNGVIGADGGLPWHLPDDLRRFKALTMGHTMIMGRRTFESIGRALPGRVSIVVTRDAGWTAPGVTVAHSVDEALALAGPGSEVMVVGGGEVYRQTLDLADRLEITHVDVDAVGDTRFPEIDPAVWQLGARQDSSGCWFASYTRRQPVSDLAELLAGMDPELNVGEYVFCTTPLDVELPPGLDPVATVREAAGRTLVLSRDAAENAGLSGTFRSAWITLRVRSALTAVGLTAAVAAALTRDGIPCNVIAGFHHDHLFVPVDQADRAVAALTALAHVRQPDTR